MRIRALILIVLTFGWLLPARGLACPPEARDAGGQAQATHHAGHAHSHASADHAEPGHHHAAGFRPSDPGAPLEAPTCCRDGARMPTSVASLLNAEPRPRWAPLALPTLRPDAPRPEPSAGAAQIRLRYPLPPPYAHTHRPLLI